MSTVLVVDDDPGVRQTLRGHVEAEGHRVLEACDASSARQTLARERVDLIFLDAQMPGESGTAFCHSMKDDPDCQDIRVVLLTPFDDERAWHQGLRSGADLFTMKPVSRDQIRVLLQELLDSDGARP